MKATDNAAAARECMMSGTRPMLLMCSASAETLSKSAREFVRELRGEGVRVEFHAPGSAEALLQSTNRLLAEIPLESLMAAGTQHPPHLLIIDDAESLTAAEGTSLRRIVQGLRGSPFRTVLLVRGTKAELQRLPISEISDLAMIWEVDGLSGDEAIVDEPRVSTADAEPVMESVPTQSERPIEITEPIPDVLAELARERAETRGFDVTLPRRRLGMQVKVAAVLLVFVFIGYTVNRLWTPAATTSPLVYDCGLHGDRESVDVLIARIGRIIPTSVTAESKRFRLQVGPFPSESAAKAARAQVWRLGACRLEPVVARASTATKRKVGG